MTDLPESPTSITWSVTSPKGYNALLTVRDAEFKELAEKMEFVEKWLEDKGYKPQVKAGYQKKEVEYVEGRTCPNCGGRLVKQVTKTGKTMIKCENGKYNFATRQNEGCAFVEWPN
jgi:hypothetical protein